MEVKNFRWYYDCGVFGGELDWGLYRGIFGGFLYILGVLVGDGDLYCENGDIWLLIFL